MSENPYETPVYGQPGSGPVSPFKAAPRGTSLGAFVLTMLILDLVFCGLRLMLGAFGLAGYAVIPPDDPMRQTVIFEVATAFGIALFGFAGDTLILLKKKIGIPVAAIKIAFTVGSVVAGVWQGFLQFQQFPGDMSGPEGAGFVVGFFIGAGFVVLIRLVLLGLYIAALVKANKILSRE